MTDLAERYGTASPRTAERPMAFTGAEFARGAFAAWLLFNLLAPLALGGISAARGLAGGSPESLSYSLLLLWAVPMVALPVSLAVLLVGGAPLALLLARALRGIPSARVHLAVFGGLGVAVGAVGALLWQWWSQPEAGDPAPGALEAGAFGGQIDWLAVAALACVAGIAVAAGWGLGMRGALRAAAPGAG